MGNDEEMISPYSTVNVTFQFDYFETELILKELLFMTTAVEVERKFSRAIIYKSLKYFCRVSCLFESYFVEETSLVLS